MSNDKFKIFRVNIVLCIIGALSTGINFVLSEQPAMGIAFVVAISASIFNLFCYVIEHERKDSD